MLKLVFFPISSKPKVPARTLTDMERQANVNGDPLEVCSLEPLTGFFGDGFTTSGPEDVGAHTVCAVVTAEFLDHQKLIGNDLSTPMPQYGFPGLQPGDRWAVCAARCTQSYAAGVKTPVVLYSAASIVSTHGRARTTEFGIRSTPVAPPVPIVSKLSLGGTTPEPDLQAEPPADMATPDLQPNDL